MIAKISVWAKTREEAIRKAQSALGEVIIEGVDTNVDYQYSILEEPDYRDGNVDIRIFCNGSNSESKVYRKPFLNLERSVDR